MQQVQLKAWQFWVLVLALSGFAVAPTVLPQIIPPAAQTCSHECDVFVDTSELAVLVEAALDRQASEYQYTMQQFLNVYKADRDFWQLVGSYMYEYGHNPWPGQLRKLKQNKR